MQRLPSTRARQPGAWADSRLLMVVWLRLGSHSITLHQIAPFACSMKSQTTISIGCGRVAVSTRFLALDDVPLKTSLCIATQNTRLNTFICLPMCIWLGQCIHLYRFTSTYLRQMHIPKPRNRNMLITHSYLQVSSAALRRDIGNNPDSGLDKCPDNQHIGAKTLARKTPQACRCHLDNSRSLKRSCRLLLIFVRSLIHLLPSYHGGSVLP